MKYGTTFIDGGFRPAIGKEGPKWTQVVFRDGNQIRVSKVKTPQRFTPIAGRKPYTLVKLARRLLRSRNSMGSKMHVSKTAKKILREASL